MGNLGVKAFFLLFVAYLAALSVAVNTFGNCVSYQEAAYELPNTLITKLNYFSKASSSFKDLLLQGCPPIRDAGSVCPDRPAIGSGLTQVSSNYFLGLTDRGPNQDCTDLYALDPIKYASAKDKIGKGFPIPYFAPSIVHFAPDQFSRELNIYRSVPLRGRDLKPITGLSNTILDDTPYGPNCAGPQLPYDPSGLDTEDIAQIPGTDYVALVDEYSPSVVIANYQTGVIVARHVPKSLGYALAAARYEIVADIPDVYKNRRSNRGFEAVVVDAKRKYIIAIVQSPMLGDNSSLTENNAIIRCAYFSMTISSTGVPKLKYSKSFIIEASSPVTYMDTSNGPKDMKYSAAQYRSEGKFIALERAKGQIKLFLVDWSTATNIDQTKYADNLNLEKDTNGVFLAKQFGILSAKKVLIWDSIPGVGGTSNYKGSDKIEGFAIDVIDDSKLWIINDNDFGLENSGNTEMLKISLGRAPDGATVCDQPPHPPAPRINLKPTKKIKLKNSSTFRISDNPGAGAAENLDVNEKLKRIYVANDEKGTVDVYSANKKPVRPLKSYNPGTPYLPTSTSVCQSTGLIAVGLANDENDTAPGRIDIITKKLEVVRRIQDKRCVLVDHVKWSDDCRFLIGACEGEGASVPGGIIVADFAGPLNNRYRGFDVATFRPFDAVERFFDENGVRLIESRLPSIDLEPEYITIAGNNAFVTLQENNAIAVVDLYEAVVTELKPIGYIDRSREGFRLDASDKDGKIRIVNYDYLFGMPQPDAIQSYIAQDGMAYLVFANEGDAKEVEEYRGGDITATDELNRKAVPGLKRLIEDETLLGRLRFSSLMGYNVSSNTQENVFHFGSRSFSIMALDGTVVFDSGEWFAQIQKKFFPKIFNANGFDDENLSKSIEDLFDNRSDDKGMEPESLSLMKGKDGRNYAFVSFERSSIIVVFDITIPMFPIFVEAVQNNPTNLSIEKMFSEGKQGDIDPEGLYASSKLSKLFVAGSVSNTVSSYDIVM